jgi:hypothetical protein
MLIGDLGFGVKCADNCCTTWSSSVRRTRYILSVGLHTMFCRSSLLSAQFNYLCNPINLFWFICKKYKERTANNTSNFCWSLVDLALCRNKKIYLCVREKSKVRLHDRTSTLCVGALAAKQIRIFFNIFFTLEKYMIIISKFSKFDL